MAVVVSPFLRGNTCVQHRVARRPTHSSRYLTLQALKYRPRHAAEPHIYPTRYVTSEDTLTSLEIVSHEQIPDSSCPTHGFYFAFRH